ncbi:MAG: shikimate dehydrogenase [Pseudomonadota bacterium]
MTAKIPAACVLGFPARHSRSPKLHGYWLKRYGIAGSYCIEEVTPAAFPEFLSTLASRGYVGANVTIPHKEAAFQLSDPDQRAQAVGAANTLWLEGGVLKSTNTDVEGFIGALDAAAPNWDRHHDGVIVLGAGGAGRAVVYGLLERGIPRVHVVNRSFEKAVALKERFGDAILPAHWDQLPSLLKGAHLLVNSTSLGMAGQPPLEVDLEDMSVTAVVADIVYVPLKTPLLRAAQARGLATSNGLEMLLYQAVTGFEHWFGKRPDVTRELYDLLAADIAKD